MDMLTTVRRMSLLINLAHHPMLRITSIRLDFGFHLRSPCKQHEYHVIVNAKLSYRSLFRYSCTSTYVSLRAFQYPRAAAAA